MSRPDPTLWVTVLAGGVGSRFWPASTPSRPKQLLTLAGDAPLIVQTVERALRLVPPDRLRLLIGRSVHVPIAGALPNLPDATFMVEPEARGTAPVLAWAAHHVARTDPDAVLVSLHADHVIRPVEAFVDLLRGAGRIAAREGKLLTVAVPPTRPETGYGYVRTGEPLEPEGSADGYLVSRFVEKPDRETAERYLVDGYLWNSGIFIWTAGVFLEEVRRCAPEIGEHLHLLDEERVGDFFDAVPNLSVDDGVLQRSDEVATVKATFDWDDVGSWEALSRTRPADDAGNVRVGAVQVVDGENNIAYAEDGALVLFGVDDLVAVHTAGVTLVTHRSRTADLKALLSRLPQDLKNPEAE